MRVMDIIIKKFNMEEDFVRVEEYLRDRYFENKNMTSWLPQRFYDLIYRLDAQYTEQPGMPASKDYIYLWEEGDSFESLVVSDEGDKY